MSDGTCAARSSLGARDLIVIKLHRIDGAAAKFVVLRVWTENRTQQDAGLRAFRMGGRIVLRYWKQHGSALILIIRFSPLAVITMLEAVSGSRYVVAQISQKNYKPADSVRGHEYCEGHINLNRTAFLA